MGDREYAPNAETQSGIESNAASAGVGFASAPAWPLTPFVPLAGSPLTSAGIVCGGDAVLQDSVPFSCWYISVASDCVYASVARAVVDWQCLERITELG